MKSYMAKTGELQVAWHLVDATDQVLGRMASSIAMILMGKHRPEYTPHIDTGDFVVVINAEKVKLTGNKWAAKEYDHFTGYPGGRRVMTAQQVRQTHPERLLEEAVRRMLPKNKLAVHMLSKLKVYAGPSHPHQAQQPKELKL